MSDWETVTVLKKKPQKASALKTEQAVNRARREGVPVETQIKWGGGQNKQHVSTKNTAKLDRETEELKHETIPLSLGKLIQQGRQAKGWSQKEFATEYLVCLDLVLIEKKKKPDVFEGTKRCNEKPQVVNDYEAGRGIPNQAIIGKMERVLGIKLRGKDLGKPLVPPGKK